MSIARIERPLNAHQRIDALEKRADGHDHLIKPMAEQVKEMYELLTRWRNINWFLVKAVATGGGALGVIAALLSIADKLSQLFGHHP